MKPTPAHHYDINAEEQALIADAREQAKIETGCKWKLGELASRWTQIRTEGRTDADFAMLVGLSREQVTQRRRCWEVFCDTYHSHPELSWSHFYVAINWDDSAECLAMAAREGWSVKEMEVWRDTQHAVEYEEPSGCDYQPPTATPINNENEERNETIPSVNESVRSTTASVNRDPQVGDSEVRVDVQPSGASGVRTADARTESVTPAINLAKLQETLAAVVKEMQRANNRDDCRKMAALLRGLAEQLEAL